MRMYMPFSIPNANYPVQSSTPPMGGLNFQSANPNIKNLKNYPQPQNGSQSKLFNNSSIKMHPAFYNNGKFFLI